MTVKDILAALEALQKRYDELGARVAVTEHGEGCVEMAREAYDDITQLICDIQDSEVQS